jgi:2,4-dienoyl-CoA reductase-like NADH-dependent reductase (Old Yellow Enzyme family)
VELVRTIRKAIGSDMPILFRFAQSQQQDFNAGIAETPDELGVMLGALAAAGVDMFVASTIYFGKPAFDGSDFSPVSWAEKPSGKPSMTVGASASRMGCPAAAPRRRGNREELLRCRRATGSP